MFYFKHAAENERRECVVVVIVIQDCVLSNKTVSKFATESRYRQTTSRTSDIGRKVRRYLGDVHLQKNCIGQDYHQAGDLCMWHFWNISHDRPVSVSANVLFGQRKFLEHLFRKTLLGLDMFLTRNVYILNQVTVEIYGINNLHLSGLAVEHLAVITYTNLC